MERLISQERANDGLRKEDLRIFWKGFQKFRLENPELESEMRSKISVEAAKLGINGPNDGATELTMLFHYSVSLARSMNPELSVRVPPLKLIITDDNLAFCRSSKGFGPDSPSWFEAGIRYLLMPESSWNYKTKPWSYDITQTVSKHLTDTSVFFAAMAGPEELAHEYFHRFKSKKISKDAFNQYRRIYRENSMMLESGEFDIAGIHYHTADTERRGLVWTLRFVKKYFPHWAGPTRDLSDKVSAIRYHRNRSKRPNFWQKIFE